MANPPQQEAGTIGQIVDPANPVALIYSVSGQPIKRAFLVTASNIPVSGSHALLATPIEGRIIVSSGPGLMPGNYDVFDAAGTLGLQIPGKILLDMYYTTWGLLHLPWDFGVDVVSTDFLSIVMTPVYQGGVIIASRQKLTVYTLAEKAFARRGESELASGKWR